jgi:cell division protein ZapB
MSETDNFEQKLDQLIELCQQLKRDNHALRNREDELLGERSQLMKKNDMARQKVETMINRLQALSSE